MRDLFCGPRVPRCDITMSPDPCGKQTMNSSHLTSLLDSNFFLLVNMFHDGILRLHPDPLLFDRSS